MVLLTVDECEVQVEDDTQHEDAVMNDSEAICSHTGTEAAVSAMPREPTPDVLNRLDDVRYPQTTNDPEILTEFSTALCHAMTNVFCTLDQQNRK